MVVGRATAGFSTLGEVFQSEQAGGIDLFIARLDAEEIEPLYVTLFGGRGDEVCDKGVHVTPDGLTTIVGHTSSADLPLKNAFQGAHRGGGSDAFVVQARPDGKLAAADQIVYSTFIGGSGQDHNFDMRHVQVTEDGRITVFFNTWSTDLPMRGASFQPVHAGSVDSYLAVLDPARVGSAQLVYSTYLGGGGIEEPRWLRWLDASTILLVGETGATDFPATERRPFGGWNDVFVTVLDVERRTLVYSTTFGGQWWDLPQDVLLTDTGEIVVAGCTASGNFPLVSAIGDFQPNEYTHAMVFVFRPGDAGRPGEVRVSTSLGGRGTFDFIECARAIVEESPGVYLVAGHTGTPLLPTTEDALHREFGGGTHDIVLARLDLRRPDARFSWNPESGTAPLEVCADAAGSSTPNGTALETFTYDFGDGSEPVMSDDEATVCHRYEAAGVFEIGLTVTNDRDLDAVTTGTVTVGCGSGEVTPWRPADIGAVQLTGGTRWVDGDGDGSACLALCAAGRSLATREDALHFVHQEVATDGALSARIKRVDAANPLAAVGLMWRESLEPEARYAAMLVDASGRVLMRHRSAIGATTVRISGETVGFPVALRLERRRDANSFTVFTGFARGGGDEGAPWTEVGVATLENFAAEGAIAPPLAGVFATAALSSAARTFAALAAEVCDLELREDAAPPRFLRGDSNADGATDLSDAITTLGFLFLGNPLELACKDAADANDDGDVDVSDAIWTLTFKFLGGVEIPAPGPDTCGMDPTADGLPICSYDPAKC